MAKRKSNEELHRELWGWLAETGADYKSDWPGWKKRKDKVGNQCFACNEAGMIDDVDPACDRCPIRWEDTYGEKLEYCQTVGSTYSDWEDAVCNEGTMRQKKLAAIIRDLPWKKGGWK